MFGKFGRARPISFIVEPYMPLLTSTLPDAGSDSPLPYFCCSVWHTTQTFGSWTGGKKSWCIASLLWHSLHDAIATMSRCGSVAATGLPVAGIQSYVRFAVDCARFFVPN